VSCALSLPYKNHKENINRYSHRQINQQQFSLDFFLGISEKNLKLLEKYVDKITWQMA